jgi:hypothetical protein
LVQLLAEALEDNDEQADLTREETFRSAARIFKKFRIQRTAFRENRAIMRRELEVKCFVARFPQVRPRETKPMLLVPSPSVAIRFIEGMNHCDVIDQCNPIRDPRAFQYDLSVNKTRRSRKIYPPGVLVDHETQTLETQTGGCLVTICPPDERQLALPILIESDAELQCRPRIEEEEEDVDEVRDRVATQVEGEVKGGPAVEGEAFDDLIRDVLVSDQSQLVESLGSGLAGVAPTEGETKVDVSQQEHDDGKSQQLDDNFGLSNDLNLLAQTFGAREQQDADLRDTQSREAPAGDPGVEPGTQEQGDSLTTIQTAFSDELGSPAPLDDPQPADTQPEDAQPDDTQPHDVQPDDAQTDEVPPDDPSPGDQVVIDRGAPRPPSQVDPAISEAQAPGEESETEIMEEAWLQVQPVPSGL